MRYNKLMKWQASVVIRKYRLQKKSRGESRKVKKGVKPFFTFRSAFFEVSLRRHLQSLQLGHSRNL